jgi:hypothetical protein
MLIAFSTFAQTDIYKKDIIRYNLKEQAGKKEGNRILNDQLEIDVFVKDFSIEKAKKVCAYYKDFYKEKAKKKGNRLTIYIEVWSKKILPSQIDNVNIQNKYYHGGINYNYYNENYFEDIY